MDAARHQRLTEHFASARHAPPAARAELLAQLRAEDDELAVELAALLAEHDAAPQTTDLPLPAALRAILAQVEVPSSTALSREDAAHPPDRDAPDLALDQALGSIGRYRLIRRLGEGGMGVVYLAEQEHPRRQVALKVMRQAFGHDGASMRRRFEIETQLLARLEHPGVARLYDAGTAPVEDGAPGAAVPYFAMEYVHGCPLLEHAERHALPLRARLELLQRICAAVAAAHRQGVIHRDLKPGNILVDSTGQPRILDFGVARAVGGDTAVTTAHTDVGQLIGTLPYMSPEQVSGDPRRIDARCDVYALGVLAYQLLSGKLPLDVRQLSIAEAARRISDDDPTPLGSIDRTLRGDVDTIVAKAMEKDPQRRYQTVDALGEDIARWLHHEPILARPATTVYQLGRFARRNRGLVGGIALAFLMLVAGLVGTVSGLLEARRKADVASEAQRLAGLERDAALAAEARASRRFNDLRKLAKAFIYDVHDGIVDLPGSTEVRHDIVARGLEYLDSLASEAAGDPRLQQEVAEAYVKIGQAQGYHAKGNLGDRAAALESFTKARRIREALVAADPSEPAWIIGLLSVRNFIGNIHFSEGRYEDALREFADVRRQREGVVAMVAGDEKLEREARRALSLSWQWIGNALKYLERFDEALAAYRSQLELATLLHLPGDPFSTRDLTVAHEKVGDGLRDLERNDESLVEYLRSLELRRGMAESNPENSELQMDLAVSLGRVARLMLASGALAEARPRFTESRDLVAAVVAADPRNVLALSNLSVCEYRLGEVAAAEADQAQSREEAVQKRIEAIAAIDRALAIFEELQRDGRLEARFVAGIEEFRAARQELVEKNR
jgi:tetratricopeptide (TPR) repeat protein/predicted Ser/Thr protein kinase